MVGGGKAVNSGVGCQFRANNGLGLGNWLDGVDDDYAMLASKTGLHSKTTTRLQGMYAATRLSVTDPLSLILGVRSTDYSATTVSVNDRRERQRHQGRADPWPELRNRDQG
ncbi:hypothetical protein WR25_21632 [Diploscapter pachys]|uniref:Uncharacterized protein n=1 Tax=Diploscapter pachys TaxID=2018661 RepID=A0A2A2KHJ9_9BILA|nr:hypothetical protein WR25_21632 [Diploscapter pachys]